MHFEPVLLQTFDPSKIVWEPVQTGPQDYVRVFLRGLGSTGVVIGPLLLMGWVVIGRRTAARIIAGALLLLTPPYSPVWSEYARHVGRQGMLDLQLLWVGMVTVFALCEAWTATRRRGETPGGR